MLPCISELDVKNYKGLQAGFDDICTLELTVATGLEEVAAQECREKLNVKPFTFRGRVIFDLPIKDVPEILKLRSIENINVLLDVNPIFSFSNERDECFEKMYQHATSPDWRKGMKVWQSVFGAGVDDPFKAEQDLKSSCCAPRPELDLKLIKNESGILANLPEEVLSSIFIRREEEKEAKEKQEQNKLNGAKAQTVPAEAPKKQNKDLDDKQRQGHGPKFRVSCHRVGSTHKFGSSEAARQFGGGINEKFGWPVDLTHFDLEVLFNIIKEFVYVAFSLTKEPLFKRNLTFFGPTNLRSTICYNMLHLAKPQPGDFILDPMCGGCSIPIEGALTFPQCFHLGGDNFEAAAERSQKNISHLVTEEKKSLCIDAARWDATSLPLRDQMVDVVVCDLPFGKRVGSKADNRVLYFKSLLELARVTKVETGRAILLTHDKRSITNSLVRLSSLWKNFSTRSINIGGLVGGIYLLQRTGLFSNPSIQLEGANGHSKGRKRKLSGDEAT